MRPRARSTLYAAALASCLAASGASAALVPKDLDGNAATAEAFFDSVLGITWLADWNHAKTSGYDADGAMTWAAASTWAANLSIGGYSDWRLPSSNVSRNRNLCRGFGCFDTDQELGHLWSVSLGNSGNVLTQRGGFTNMQDLYWTSEFIIGTHGGMFDTRVGAIGDDPLQNSHFAVAVHAGEIGGAVVTPSAVPEPAAWVLALTGLGLAGSARRRR